MVSVTVDFGSECNRQRPARRVAFVLSDKLLLDRLSVIDENTLRDRGSPNSIFRVGDDSSKASATFPNTPANHARSLNGRAAIKNDTA